MTAPQRDEARSRPSVRMDEDECWSMVADAHTGILTTLRRDGVPISLPVWFAVVDRVIYVTTRGKKLSRVRADQRSAFLVEAGERWADLRAVHLTGSASLVEPDADLRARIGAEMDRKYAAYRTASAAMPRTTREHYVQARGGTIAFVADPRILSWDNRRLGLS